MAIILLVEDDVSVRRAVRRMLERAGHRVLETGNGVDALVLLETTAPDILITDVHMPDCDGFELTRTLRKSNRPQPRVIVVSGSGDGPILAQALAAGATLTLPKPFTREELLEAVHKAQAA